jgi:hypothetical protein
MTQKVLKVHPDDNVVVALANLSKDETVALNGQQWQLQETIPAKHKFVTHDLQPGDPVTMYAKSHQKGWPHLYRQRETCRKRFRDTR